MIKRQRSNKEIGASTMNKRGHKRRKENSTIKAKHPAKQGGKWRAANQPVEETASEMAAGAEKQIAAIGAKIDDPFRELMMNLVDARGRRSPASLDLQGEPGDDANKVLAPVITKEKLWFGLEQVGIRRGLNLAYTLRLSGCRQSNVTRIKSRWPSTRTIARVCYRFNITLTQLELLMNGEGIGIGAGIPNKPLMSRGELKKVGL